MVKNQGQFRKDNFLMNRQFREPSSSSNRNHWLDDGGNIHDLAQTIENRRQSHIVNNNNNNGNDRNNSLTTPTNPSRVRNINENAGNNLFNDDNTNHASTGNNPISYNSDDPVIVGIENNNVNRNLPMPSSENLNHFSTVTTNAILQENSRITISSAPITNNITSRNSNNNYNTGSSSSSNNTTSNNTTSYNTSSNIISSYNTTSNNTTSNNTTSNNTTSYNTSSNITSSNNTTSNNTTSNNTTSNNTSSNNTSSNNTSSSIPTSNNLPRNTNWHQAPVENNKEEEQNLPNENVHKSELPKFPKISREELYQTRYEARKKAISKFKKTKTLKHSDYGKSKSAKAPNIPPDPFQGMLDFKEHLKSALADSIPSLSKARINDVTSAALLCYRQWDSLINSQKKMIEQATMMHKQNYFQTMQMNIQMNGENNYHDDESDNYSEGSYSDFYLESE